MRQPAASLNDRHMSEMAVQSALEELGRVAFPFSTSLSEFGEAEARLTCRMTHVHFFIMPAAEDWPPCRN